jgi:thiamine-monophosphate kinase
MGGTPHLALVTLALPADFCVEDVVALYKGLYAAAKAYDVVIGGGDIVRSPVFMVTVALSGWAYQPQVGGPQVMRRDRAQVGDLVAVTGELGAAAGGLRVLIDRYGIEENAAAAERLRNAQERPVPRVATGKAAVRNGIRCAIDVSDGLVQDLRHIVRASSAGIRVDANRIPVSSALQDIFPGRGIGFALAGGEDYELILVGSRGAIEDLMAATDVPITEIGEVVHFHEPRLAIVDEDGRELPMGEATGGWDHFATP